MILIGHPYIDFKPFEKIEKKEDIANTSSGAVVVFDFQADTVSLCQYAKNNDVLFALFVREESDVVLASALGAAYIICDKSLVKTAQTFADDYLFDAKILLESDSEEDIVYAAKNSIDGIIFKKGIAMQSIVL